MDWRQATRILLPLLALAACLLVFVPGLSGPFLLDDLANLETLRIDQLDLGNVYRGILNNPSGLLLRPISNLTLLLQQAMGDGHSFGFKLFNLLVHGINGFLLWRLCILIAGALSPRPDQANTTKYMALLAAMLWTLHPLQVSSVLYVVQRMTLLSGTFILLSVTAAVAPLLRPGALRTPASGVLRTAIVGLLAVLALLSKETGALVPFMLLAIWLAVPDASRETFRDTPGKRVFAWTAVYLPVLAGLAAAVALWPKISAGYSGRHFAPLERLISESWILLDYLTSIFVPLPQRMGLLLDDTPVIRLSTAGWWIAPLVLLAMASAAALVRRRYPFVTFAIYWFLACHLLESTVLPLELKFEHRNYLALLGPMLLLARGVATLGKAISARTAVATGAVLVVLMAGLTSIRSDTWSTDVKFIAFEARHHPNSARAQLEMARLESNNGRDDLAYQRVEAAIGANPDHYGLLLYDMFLGCKAGTPVRWDDMRRHIRTHPDDFSIRNDYLYGATLSLLLSHRCQPGFDAAFRAHVDDATALYRSRRLPLGQTFFQVMQAQMESDPRLQRTLIAGIPEETQTTDLRLRVAYLDLYLGDFESAEDMLSRLKATTPAWHPDYPEVRTFEANLLKAKEQGSNGKSGGGAP
ncbi:hypothetical protein GCM10027084_03860 [Pseudoxanthomonas sangjuensis]|uniref:hypothetical protein n=1 Tax=Pseudoxanthomonas sangjuensis TaxID=1503750 RepID=UPI0013916055|nr:hypothetical protein [Pseudoxanthomonas sangjuensis]KAF1713238.1 hypothetical protein CSC71_08810 [Pseudoxanthomonas sangjuensis]